MRIAVTYENENVFEHFGHAKQIKIYDCDSTQVTDSKVMATMCCGHASMASLLKVIGANVLICGCIGGGAKLALKEKGIEIYAGVSGSADKAVEAFLKGELNFNSDAKCDHH